MYNLLLKELKLSSSILSYIFIIFGLMFFLPGYPILCGPFFVTLGIFQSFQNSRENNDILFTALLPVSKKDIVKSKFLFVCIIELFSIILMSFAVVIRMTILSTASAYLNNALMNANLFALGLAFFIFGLFNLIFVGGFFKTAYKFLKPFILYIISSFLTIFIGETLHHIPGFEIINSFGTTNIFIQLISFMIGIIIYLFLTFIALVLSCNRFERIDL